MNRVEILFCLIISSLVFSTSQELSKRKCDEYYRKNEAIPERNEYRKYMNKFVTAKTINEEYDAVLISEEYALTSVRSSITLKFTAVIVNNRSVEVYSQDQRDDIYLMKLSHNAEVYHKIVCLWNLEDLPVGFNFFTVVHNTDVRRVPLLRTYVPNITSCPFIQSYLQQTSDNFCLSYENGRQSETVFQNPTASSLIFLKSFHNNAGLNKNHYIMGVLKETQIIYGQKLWPNLRWIENVVWKLNQGVEAPLKLEPECGNLAQKNFHQTSVRINKFTYRGEFPWQAALFEVTKDQDGGKGEYKCGGSLLNQDTVLTAAHCITNTEGELKKPGQYLIKLGLYNLDNHQHESGVKTVNVFEFIKHELYNASSHDNDIAIIKLSTDVTYTNYIRPICLIGHTRSFETEEGVVTGWGGNENNQIPHGFQRKGTFRIQSRNDCRHNAGSFIKDRLTEVNYCAINKDGQNVCSGDSGSGMVAKIDHRWYLRGVISYGAVTDGICNSRTYSLSSCTIYFHDWIIAKML